ncbi:unnamed protein product [Nezara viridula]|uniref:Uncharacterized protein n=1 Tax=Nezara viridula TaxID=85310 RepID=A0A9P0H0P6_NEZVI|nr:unnamed protein product [Nezara viridula]
MAGQRITTSLKQNREVIGFSSMIPLQLTRSGQLSSGYKRTFQSLSLLRIGTQEALISAHKIILEDGMPQSLV